MKRRERRVNHKGRQKHGKQNRLNVRRKFLPRQIVQIQRFRLRVQVQNAEEKQNRR